MSNTSSICGKLVNKKCVHVNQEDIVTTDFVNITLYLCVTGYVLFYLTGYNVSSCTISKVDFV